MADYKYTKSKQSSAESSGKGGGTKVWSTRLSFNKECLIKNEVEGGYWRKNKISLKQIN